MSRKYFDGQTSRCSICKQPVGVGMHVCGNGLRHIEPPFSPPMPRSRVYYPYSQPLYDDRCRYEPPRKRWPAIEPHSRLLYADGSLGGAMSHDDARINIRQIKRTNAILGMKAWAVPIAIIKVTPK